MSQVMQVMERIHTTRFTRAVAARGAMHFKRLPRRGRRRSGTRARIAVYPLDAGEDLRVPEGAPDADAASTALARWRQRELPFVSRGGARPGAGRKREGERPSVAHRPRAEYRPRHPLLVTARLVPCLPSLRGRAELRVLLQGLRESAGRFGLHVVHFSAQSNHLHFLVEADGPEALSRGMKGLLVRLARGWNRLWQRRGRVLADRFHARELTTPTEARNALRYVLTNHRHHGVGEPGPDPWSSGAWFEGWTVDVRWLAARSGRCPVEPARTWLLTTGWQRHGRLRFDEVPSGSGGGRRRASASPSASSGDDGSSEAS